MSDVLPGATPKTGQNTTITNAASQLIAPPSGSAAGVGRASGGVLVRALTANTQPCWVGSSSGVTTGNGYPLYPGDAVALNVDDPSRVWAIATSGTQTLAYLYL